MLGLRLAVLYIARCCAGVLSHVLLPYTFSETLRAHDVN
jgi:hypothetical protein